MTHEEMIYRMRSDSLREAMKILTRQELEEVTISFALILQSCGAETEIAVSINVEDYNHDLVERAQKANKRVVEEAERLFKKKITNQ